MPVRILMTGEQVPLVRPGSHRLLPRAARITTSLATTRSSGTRVCLDCGALHRRWITKASVACTTQRRLHSRRLHWRRRRRRRRRQLQLPYAGSGRFKPQQQPYDSERLATHAHTVRLTTAPVTEMAYCSGAGQRERRQRHQRPCARDRQVDSVERPSSVLITLRRTQYGIRASWRQGSDSGRVAVRTEQLSERSVAAQCFDVAAAFSARGHAKLLHRGSNRLPGSSPSCTITHGDCADVEADCT
jgi:hypothetical protein